MNAKGMQSTIDEYDQAAKAISKHLGHMIRGDVDEQGRSRDDYHQDLRLHAIETAERFQNTKGFCLPAERRYVHKSLWNLARDWQRTNNKARSIRYSVPIDEMREERTEQWYDPHDQLSAIHDINRLKEKLPSNTWELLCRVAECGSARAAFDPARDGNISTHRLRVATAVTQAKKILRT